MSPEFYFESAAYSDQIEFLLFEVVNKTPAFCQGSAHAHGLIIDYAKAGFMLASTDTTDNVPFTRWFLAMFGSKQVEAMTVLKECAACVNFYLTIGGVKFQCQTGEAGLAFYEKLGCPTRWINLALSHK